MTQKADRLAFLDNLKSFIIFGVVLYHVGWVYEKSGVLANVWIVSDPAKTGSPGIINLILDIFMMPTMFFISGYFAYRSLKRKSAVEFLKARLKRLALPFIAAALILIPLYKVIFLYSRGLPQGDSLSFFHFGGQIPMNLGWLWFLPVLFLFDFIYLVLAKYTPLQWKLGLKGTVGIVLAAGFAYSFCMSFYGLYGWTKTLFLDFQNERILVYFMSFLVGTLGGKLQVFSRPSSGKTLYYALCATIWIPMNVYVIFLLNLIFNPGRFIVSHVADVALVWLGFQLSLWGMLYILLNTFRYYLNRGGALARTLGDCSYGVYIIHFVVLGVLALPLLHISLPAMAKYIILLVATYLVSNLLTVFYKAVKVRIGPVGRSI